MRLRFWTRFTAERSKRRAATVDRLLRRRSRGGPDLDTRLHHAEGVPYRPAGGNLNSPFPPV